MEGLDQSIECCEAWKDAYNNAAATHNRFCEIKWLLDRSSIFAQIDAFVQRCKDLKEVQVHFNLVHNRLTYLVDCCLYR